MLTLLAPALGWLLTSGLRRLTAKRMEERRVRLDGMETVDVSARDLELAYCSTVHTPPGSRSDTVVFVMPPVAKEFAEEVPMQYVGLTRGRRATWCYAW